MANDVKRVCVFCGSAAGNRDEYREAATQIGELLAAEGLHLVFGGGHIGLMGILADAVLNSGGVAIGVIPKALVDRELAHTRLSKLHVVNTMHERKAMMSDLSDGFIALPGGYGTCDELFEIITWAQLHLHSKPVGLLNVAGYFDHLLLWLDETVTAGFVDAAHRQLLISSSDPKVLLRSIRSHQPRFEEPAWIEERER